MSLDVIEIRDLRTWAQGFISAVIERDLPGNSTHDDTSAGWNPGCGDGNDNANSIHYSIYNQARDQIVTICPQTKTLPSTATALNPSIYSCDALFRNPAVGWYREGATLLGSFVSRHRVKAGQFNPQTGEQRIYARTPSAHVELDPVTGGLIASGFWTGIPNDFAGSTVSDTSIDTAGEWRVQTTAAPEQRAYQPIIFEGITDTTGYVAETSPNAGILRGGNSHPEGLALVQAGAVNFIGGGAGNNVGSRWVWVDLDTGLAVGCLGIPTRADSSSTGEFAEASIDGRAFDWRGVQFVPDEGSTFAQPKGELHLYTTLDGSFVLPGITVTAPEQSFSSTVTRNYVAVHDFNPFNASGGTIRVHNRRRFVGVIDVPQEPIISGGFDATNSGIHQLRSMTPIYHPPSRTYVVFAGHPTTAAADGADDPAVGQSRVIRFRRAVVVGDISKPTPTSEVSENRTIRARVIVNTDLSELASGVTVDFEIFRLSTRAETFDGTAQGSTPYQVDAEEIDEDGHLDVREADDVDGGGTLLVEGVDFTVNYGTGTLTPTASWPADDVFVRYRHRGVRLTPAHGTLISSSAVTDGSGQAFALVRYGDALDGEIDGIEATA